MQLNLEHPIFEEKSLILVTGSHDGKLYEVTNEEIEEVGNFVAENPDKQYTDEEEHFQQKTGQDGFVSGGAREPNKDIYIRNFTTQLEKLTADYLRKDEHSKLYIFTPDFMKNYVQEIIDKYSNTKLAKNYELIKEGNYTHQTPKEIVDMIITHEKDEVVDPIPEEEQKINEKSEMNF